MTTGKITHRARREYVAILRDHLRARLRQIEDEPARAETRAVDEIRAELEVCGEEHARDTEGGLRVYRGPRPLRLRIVVDPATGDVVSVLPQSERQRR